MTRRLIETIEGPPGLKNQVRVMFDIDWNEYICCLFHDGKHIEPADAYTDDKEDALATARLMSKTSQS